MASLPDGWDVRAGAARKGLAEVGLVLVVVSRNGSERFVEVIGRASACEVIV